MRRWSPRGEGIGHHNEEEAMKKSVKLFAVVVGLSVLLTGLAAFGQTLNFGALTTGSSYVDRVVFEGPLGTGNPSGTFSQTRTEILVAVDYGRLIAITQSGEAAVFWYESQSGTVRNVVVNAFAPVIVNRKGNMN